MDWTHFDEPATIFALAAQPKGTCLAATEHGLWRFAKGNWAQVAPQFAQVPLSSVAVHGSTICIGASGDIAVSHDLGATFALATLPVKAHILALALSNAFEADRIGLAATAQDGVLRTADGGATWHAWNFGLLDLGVNALALSPAFGSDATCYAATDHGVFVSSNGGRAWTELPIGITNGPFTSLAVVEGKGGTRLQVGSEGHGLWTAPEPFDTFAEAKGLRASEINYVLPDAAATTQGLYIATGAKWTRVLDQGDVVCLARLDDGSLVAGTAGSGVWHGR